MSALLPRLLPIGLAAATVLGAGGGAQADPYIPGRLPAAQVTQVGEICRTTIGVPAGFELYSNCVESLSTSAARLSREVAFQDARRDCLAKGLGASALAQCEVATAASAAPLPKLAANAQPPAKSYFRASTREIRTREQTACAQVGYEPVYSGFAACVANLDAALYAADHPQR
ncbi:hypothetical protein [Phenylobacterium sp.]|uniref:hypothetical protein n=1 Tax=Phenylobacterium sp. TaxID=1871053 RepID=UPI001215272D|nr:hypothetical protein [Phenylobacterium sp.]THD61340.1 MAG: hypothetical protein E8A49_10080 [Phenylobacterium sp.]